MVDNLHTIVTLVADKLDRISYGSTLLLNKTSYHSAKKVNDIIIQNELDNIFGPIHSIITKNGWWDPEYEDKSNLLHLYLINNNIATNVMQIFLDNYKITSEKQVDLFTEFLLRPQYILTNVWENCVFDWLDTIDLYDKEKADELSFQQLYLVVYMMKRLHKYAFEKLGYNNYFADDVDIMELLISFRDMCLYETFLAKNDNRHKMDVIEQFILTIYAHFL